jgi:hypothetical protein
MLLFVGGKPKVDENRKEMCSFMVKNEVFQPSSKLP